MKQYILFERTWIASTIFKARYLDNTRYDRYECFVWASDTALLKANYFPEAASARLFNISAVKRSIGPSPGWECLLEVSHLWDTMLNNPSPLWLLRQRPNFTSTYRGVNIRPVWGPQTFFPPHGNQLPLSRWSLQSKSFKPWTPDSEGSWLPCVEKNVRGPHPALVIQ